MKITQRFKEDGLEINLSYKYKEKSKVTAEFKPVEFKGPEWSDEVLYQVRLCSERSQQFNEVQFCGHDEECVNSEVLLSVNKTAGLAVNFQEIKEGKSSVKIKATVIHRNRRIKSVQPYVMSYIDVKKKNPGLIIEENKSMFWKFVVGIMALGMVTVAALIGLKKAKGYQKSKGIWSLEITESSAKGFEIFKDEEITPEENQD